MNVNWTKVYRVRNSMDVINFYVSSHKQGYFIGAVAYFKHTGAHWATDHRPNYELALEQYAAVTEKEVYDHCDAFINAQLKGKGSYEIELEETIKPE